jgi:hypothetical protein
MVSTYSDIALLAISLTLFLSFVVGWRITREDLKGIDGTFAVLGFIFGLFMTFMNLVYTSRELFLLSPVIALSCVIYLRYRRMFKERPHDSCLQISRWQNTILNIIWWILINIAVVVYYFSEIYTRHPLFFVLVSGAVAVLGIQIITYHNICSIKTLSLIIRILLISMILRYSAYYISPYPVGSDPWAHREYISYFLEYGRISVPSDFTYYYVNYPISHLHTVVTTLIGSLSPHDSMFVLSMILTLSTTVIFIITRMLTGDVQIALISMLLLNFTDVQILWSIQVIAMSFGIAIYAFIIYFSLNRYLNSNLNPSREPKYASFMLIFLITVVWTHTISAFITLVSLFAMVMGFVLYEMMYNRNIFSIRSRKSLLLINPIIILAIVIWQHWTDPSYPFLESTFRHMLTSLSKEAEFLGAVSLSNVTGNWMELLKPVGFCMYTFFGIVGTLYCLSDKDKANKYFPLIILVLILFIFRYGFPILGIRNIIPDRWPAFAFIGFAPLIGIGIFCGLSLLKTKNAVLYALAMFLFVGSFFMITVEISNNDSPLYGERTSTKVIWTESEMILFNWINNTYNGRVIADEHTQQRPFNTYLKNKNCKTCRLLPDGAIDTQFLLSGLVIWRENSLDRPIVFSGGRRFTVILLDDHFRKYLQDNHNCISDTGGTRGYLSRTK